MSLWEEEDAIPASPNEDEARLTAQLGAEGLRTIDANLARQVRRWPSKVARVVGDALKAGGFSIHDRASFDLHVRRVIGLVESGVLVGVGNLRRARFSEVRLPDLTD